jgi:hypothetical protein
MNNERTKTTIDIHKGIVLCNVQRLRLCQRQLQQSAAHKQQPKSNHIAFSVSGSGVWVWQKQRKRLEFLFPRQRRSISQRSSGQMLILAHPTIENNNIT